jgi:hypothetical protein
METLTDRDVLRHLITVFTNLRLQMESMSAQMAATDALVRVVIERFPELAEKYARYSKQAEMSPQHPLAAKVYGVIYECDDALEQLQALVDEKFDG